MGRPITKRIFGSPYGSGLQLAISECWIPGEGSSNTSSFIMRQHNHKTFLVKNVATGNTGLVRLVQTVAAAGDARVDVLPYAAGSGATATAKLGALTATIVAGGSGYAVNDTLTVVGGTSTTAVVLTVTSVSSGAITGVSITTAGSYSVLPGVAAATTTSGSGTGATVTIATWKLVSFTVSAGGTGYTTVRVVLPGSGTATATVTAGAVASIAVSTAGSYTSIPPVSIVASGTPETLSRIASTRLVTHQGNTYFWHADGTVPGAGYAGLPLV
jgi:hypothetical protein